MGILNLKSQIYVFNNSNNSDWKLILIGSKFLTAKDYKIKIGNGSKTQQLIL